MTDFSDTPLVAGTVIGIRAFTIDRLGRLGSPSYPTIFRPGENVAECRKNEGGSFSRLNRAMLHSFYSPPTFYFDDRLLSTEKGARVEAKEPEHRPGDIGCACGWYAYYDGSNEYRSPTRISAVVEGYGKCTLGERGFRAEKARLVALFKPGRHVTADRVARAVHNYDVPLYATKREALEVHRLTPPTIPTPETCSDFWDLA